MFALLGNPTYLSGIYGGLGTHVLLRDTLLGGSCYNT